MHRSITALCLSFAMGLGLAALPAQAQPGTVTQPTRARAAEVILDASRSENPRLRLAALEAASAAPHQALPLAQLALADENPAVRFGALVTIGKLQLEGLGQAAIDLVEDPDPSVRAAALFAAQRCGRQVDLSPLAQMLGSDRPALRGNAAMLLGLLGDPGAKPMLQEMASAPMRRVSPDQREWVRLQFAEAMVRLDPTDDEIMDAVRASVYSSYEDIRVLGIQIVGDAQDRAMQDWLGQLLRVSEPVQVRIAAAKALAQMGQTTGKKVLMQTSAYSGDDVRRDVQAFLNDNRGGQGEAFQAMQQLLNDPVTQAQVAGEIRAQAAFGLGELGDAETVGRLEAMLADPEPIARLAAAGALLRAGAEQ